MARLKLPDFEKLDKRPFARFLYWVFRAYLRFIHDNIYYRKAQVINKENIPPIGEPTLVVTNHQNALNDPLMVQFSFRRRFLSIFTRADALQVPVAGRFLRWIGLLPAYRMNHEGEEALVNNNMVFEEAGSRLLHGQSVAIFPEATNQDRHWLGDFSLGYLRLAFQTAERGNFEKDIKILPAALHYDNYFSIQHDALVKYGTPISLKDYYELYKTKPRTAQRQVNALVRQQIADMMLNIENVEHYNEIDYLRNTYGVFWAKEQGVNPKDLPNRLLTDKDLCAALEVHLADNEQDALDIFEETKALQQTTQEHGIRDWVFDDNVSLVMIILRALWMLLLAPLYLFSMWPCWFVFKLPEPLVKKFEAKGGNVKLFIGGVRFTVSVIFSVPFFSLLVFLLDLFIFNACGMTGWLWGLVHVFMLPWLGLFAWQYRKAFIKGKGWFRYHRAMQKDDEFKQWPARRKALFERVECVVKNWKNRR